MQVDIRKVGAHILVRLDGQMDADGSRAAADQVVRLLDGKPVELWFDVRGLTSYAPDAREAWQDVLRPHRDGLTRVGVAWRTGLTRLGATMFAQALELPLHELSDDELDALVA